MPILHGANLSPYVRKVRVALAHKGIDYDDVQQMPFGVSDEYKALSPLGKIPCWQDGDLVLPDSSVILAYLEQVHPEPALMPAEAGARGRCLWFEEYADTKVIPCVATVFFQRFVRKNILKQEPDEAVVDKAMNVELPEILTYLEGQLGDADFLVENQFSIADIASTSGFVNFTIAGGDFDRKRFAKFDEYLSRVWSPPAYNPIVEAELPKP
jgi:glutathione S-transferase